MNNPKTSNNEIIEIALTNIGEKYGQLRLINPEVDAGILKSIKKYGQLSPVVVCREDKGRYELIDGFKRLRAVRKLSKTTKLKARQLNVGVRAIKAAIVQMNWVGRTITDMEEAMVVHSLCREDFMSQLEIAGLLGRHKSWVCRRVSIIERLNDEVKEHLRFGLISVSIGRELAKLPHGNQESAMAVIEKHGLTYHETEKLISALISSSKDERNNILKKPDKIISKKSKAEISKLNNSNLSANGIQLKQKLLRFTQDCLSIVDNLPPSSLSVTPSDLRELSSIIAGTLKSAELVIHNLKNIGANNG